MNRALMAAGLCLMVQITWAEPNSLAGSYLCKGTEYDSSGRFECQLSIQPSGQTYVLKSECRDKSHFKGTGILNGSKNLMSVVITNPDNAKETGVASIDVRDDGSLSSVWTYLDKTTVGNSQCTKVIKNP